MREWRKVLVLLLIVALAKAGPSAITNTPLCTASGSQRGPAMIADGAGGVIVAWYDTRNGVGNQDIYAQRLNSSVLQWNQSGVPVCTEPGDQNFPAIISDGRDGAIIAWNDRRSGNSDIYVQRVNPFGVLLWTANGFGVCTASGHQEQAQLVSDGAGGAIITWQDSRNGNIDIYVQRMDSSGTPLWTANGVAVCMAAGSQEYPKLVSDHASGAIIVWYDRRLGSNSDIYVQRVTSSGSPLWDMDGIPVCNATGLQEEPAICSDGAGGAVIAWQDWRNPGNNSDIYAQRVNGSGSAMWGTNGVAVCNAADYQNVPKLIRDGIPGGAIIAWFDGLTDIYAQRIDGSGTIRWLPRGVPVCTAQGEQAYQTLVSDGYSGAVITWSDRRSGNADIYAQRVDSSGTAQWTANGLLISDAANNQEYPAIVSLGTNGVMISWEDFRNGTDYDLFAQHITLNGVLVPVRSRETPPIMFSLVQNYPNPFNPSTTIAYDLPAQAHVSLKVYDMLGQEVATLVNGIEQAGRRTMNFNASNLSSGVYFYRLDAAGYVSTRKLVLLK